MSRSSLYRPQPIRHTVESLNRRFGLTTIGTVAADVVPAARAPDLTQEQKLALMTLSGSDLARDCVLKLGEQGLMASYSDFAELVKRGWAMPHGPTVHAITPMGKHHAGPIAKALARELGIHHVTRGGGNNYNVSVVCTCGWSAALSLNQGHIGSQMMRARGRHLDRVASGAWQPTDMRTTIDAIMGVTPEQRAAFDAADNATAREES